MKTSDFLLATLSVFLGTLAAVAVAALVAKKQAEQAIADARAQSPLSKLGLL